MLSVLTRMILLALLVSLSACASTSKSETTGEFFDNSMITATIKSKLVDDPLTGICRIHVNTNMGIVQLSGKVKSRKEKHRAEVIAYSVGGVKRVENALTVMPNTQ